MIKNYILSLWGISAIAETMALLRSDIEDLKTKRVVDEYLEMSELQRDNFRKKNAMNDDGMLPFYAELQKRGLDYMGEKQKPKKAFFEYQLDANKALADHKRRIEAMIKAMIKANDMQWTKAKHACKQRDSVVLNGQEYSGETICLAARQKELQKYTVDELGQAFSAKMIEQGKVMLSEIPVPSDLVAPEIPKLDFSYMSPRLRKYWNKGSDTESLKPKFTLPEVPEPPVFLQPRDTPSEKVMTISVAQFGDDTTDVLHSWTGTVHSYKKSDLNCLTVQLMKHINKYKPDVIVIRDIGISCAVIARLRMLGARNIVTWRKP